MITVQACRHKVGDRHGRGVTPGDPPWQAKGGLLAAGLASITLYDTLQQAFERLGSVKFDVYVSVAFECDDCFPGSAGACRIRPFDGEGQTAHIGPHMHGGQFHGLMGDNHTRHVGNRW